MPLLLQQADRQLLVDGVVLSQQNAQGPAGGSGEVFCGGRQSGGGCHVQTPEDCLPQVGLLDRLCQQVGHAGVTGAGGTANRDPPPIALTSRDEMASPSPVPSYLRVSEPSNCTNG